MPSLHPTPRSYAVTIKGVLANGVHFAKLAMYSFQLDGNMRDDSWIWYHNRRYEYGNTSRMIGFVDQPNTPGSLDHDKFIQGPLSSGDERIPYSFHGDESSLKTLYGKWARLGNIIHIEWSWGDQEDWAITWKDPTLYKIELIGASYLRGRLFLEQIGSTFTRERYVLNAGWEFGGSVPGFTIERSIADSQKDCTGLYIRRNIWLDPPVDQPVGEDQMNLTGFLTTDGGVLRFVDRDSAPGLWVFSYFAEPTSNPGLLASRVMYQISHDFNGDGHIDNDIGHTYCGLQVLDANALVRGFVFADSSIGEGNPHKSPTNTISSLYYLDDESEAARYGAVP